MNPRIVIACVALAALSAASACQAGDRVALVIGNGNYRGDATLRNPTNDADAIQAALEDLQFKVIKKHDVDVTQFEDALAEFRKALSPKGLGFVYYAGHGVQVSGENYLVPIGAKIEDESHVRRQCVNVNDVLSLLAQSETGVKVLVLDCCRDNPFRRNWGTRGVARGLIRIEEPPDGTLIAFATSPGKTAADGTGKNSPFADKLVAELRSRPEGGLELIDTFFQTTRAVKRATGQNPWLHVDGGLDRFVLWAKEKATPSVTTTPATTTPAPGSLLAEVLAEGPPGVVGKTADEKRILSGKLQAEVEVSITNARRLIPSNPEQAEAEIKLTLERVERSTDLEPSTRNKLRTQLFQCMAEAIRSTENRPEAIPGQNKAIGTWKWTMKYGKEVTAETLVVKLEDDRLKGTLLRGPENTEIGVGEVRLDGDKISFSVPVPKGSEVDFLTYYFGTIKGDTITGRRDVFISLRELFVNWEAKRQK